MSNDNVWHVAMGMGSVVGWKSSFGDGEFEGLKGHAVEELAQMDIRVSQDTGVAQGGYEDDRPGSLTPTDSEEGTPKLVHAVPVGLISLEEIRRFKTFSTSFHHCSRLF